MPKDAFLYLGKLSLAVMRASSAVIRPPAAPAGSPLKRGVPRPRAFRGLGWKPGNFVAFLSMPRQYAVAIPPFRSTMQRLASRGCGMTTSSFCVPSRRSLVPASFVVATLVLNAIALFSPNCAAQSGTAEQRVSRPPQAAQPADAQPPDAQAAQSEPVVPSTAQNYDKSIFQKPVAAEQLAFLGRFAGAPTNDLIRDKQYRKLMKAVIPDCIFHYGWDMMLSDAMEKVLAGSRLPVQIRDGRYLMASGRSGPYLSGRGFMWIDLRDGVALGGFFFHPTNGEPTPTVTIFSRQVKEQSLRLSQLPPAFAEDLS